MPKRLVLTLAYVIAFCLLPAFGRSQTTGYQTTYSTSGENCGENVRSFEGSPNGESPDLGWTPNSTVQVNIDTTGYTSEQVQALASAVSNWDGVAGVQLNITFDDPSFQKGAENTIYIAKGQGDMTGVNAGLTMDLAMTAKSTKRR